MPIINPVIRPPAEWDSFLLQVTVGCSANSCDFCGAYLTKPFRIIEEEAVFKDIDAHRRDFPRTRRVFFLDGDALAAGNDKLTPILKRLNSLFPGLTRVSSYANGYNITARSDKELCELEEFKMRLIYIGLESGSQNVLDTRGKKSPVNEMTEAVIRAQNAGIKASVIVLLGLGGREYSREHIRGTIDALNKMQPRYLSFLSLMLIPGTRLYNRAKEGDFKELGPGGMIDELYAIIDGLELKKTILRTDHASNYLSLRGRLPADKKTLLYNIRSARNGNLPLRPEICRGL